MYPMNFEEFLIATGKEILLNKMKECYSKMEAMPLFAHEQALTLYKQYLCVGGMPESINNFIENDLDILKYDSNIISNIIEMYIEQCIPQEEIYKKYDKSIVDEVVRKIYRMQFKRHQGCLGVRLTERAFCGGVTLPVVQKMY